MNKTDSNELMNIFDKQTKENFKIAFARLKELYLNENKLKYPNLPDYARVMPKYTDKTTNGLTKCIVDYVRLNSFHIERSGCEGRVIDNRKTVTDVLGHVKTIGSIQRIYSSSQRGTSDLKAVVNGKFIAIEIKCLATNDKQSNYQKEYQKQVENSSGIYFVAQTFSQFFEWFNQLLKGKI